MYRQITWCLGVIGGLCVLASSSPSRAQQQLNPGWNLMEARWDGKVTPGPADIDYNPDPQWREYGSETHVANIPYAVKNVVVGSWDPDDPPGDGSAGYFTIMARMTIDGDTLANRDFIALINMGGNFSCRYEWGGPGVAPTEPYGLMGLAEASATAEVTGGTANYNPYEYVQGSSVLNSGVDDGFSSGPTGGAFASYSQWAPGDPPSHLSSSTPLSHVEVVGDNGTGPSYAGTMEGTLGYLYMDVTFRGTAYPDTWLDMTGSGIMSASITPYEVEP